MVVWAGGGGRVRKIQAGGGGQTLAGQTTQHPVPFFSFQGELDG